MRGPETIKVTSYGDNKRKRPHCVVTCLHDAEPENFKKNYPDDYKKIVEATSVDPIILDRYFTRERDIGSAKFAHGIGESLQEDSGGRIRTDVVEVINVPRGIVDPNRSKNFSEKAVRRIFEHRRFPELKNRLIELHQQVVWETRIAVERIVRNGVIVDAHSMWRYSPQKSHRTGSAEGFHEVEVDPDNLEEYLELVSSPQKRGERRDDLNILTKRLNKDPIAHPFLLQELMERYKAAGIHVRLDWPYSLVDFTTTTEIMENFPYQAIALDWSRDEFLYLPAEDKNYDPFHPELDLDKIDLRSKLTALGIKKCLNGIF